VVETFPLCILEAMAARLPVVATRVGSLDEMVDDGVTGHLVPPGDVAAFASALDLLLARPDRARAMGEAGRERVLRNFDRRAMVEGTADLLRRLVAARAG
jgi:glycosyltransferase involved in cell wall biosynthesis